MWAQRAIVLLCCFCASSVFAQLKTGNKYVTGIVEPDSKGLITIRVAKQIQGWHQSITYPQKSFLTVRIGEKIYTNNNVGQNILTDPRMHGSLSDGDTRAIYDTVRTTWIRDNCIITQDVTSVDLGNHGQIVMRWRLTNLDSMQPVSAAAQFLLDVQLGSEYEDAGTPILSRYGYNTIWETFQPDTAMYRFGIPSYYFTFSSVLNASGYTRDVGFNLGLKEPSRMTIGDWALPVGSSLVDNLWGVSATAPWISNFTDGAILFEWDSVIAMPGETVELGSTSYGTGKFDVCGESRAAVSYPDHIVNEAGTLVPAPFEINAFIFDTFLGKERNTKSMTLHVGPHLRILSPDTGNTDQKVQRQLMEPTAGYIADAGALTAAWNVVADMPDCQGSVKSWIKIVADDMQLGGATDTCEHSITIDCNAPLTVGYAARGNALQLVGNPADDKALLRISVEESVHVTLSVLDITGRMLFSKEYGVLPAGVNDLSLSISDLPSGIYYVIADCGGKLYTAKLVVQ